MAEKIKISVLPPSSAPDAASMVAVVISGKTYRVRLDELLPDDVVTAGKIIGLDRSNLTVDSNPYKFRAYRNGAWTVANGSFGKISFDTENFDSNNNFDITTNVGRYTAPTAGFYQFNAGALSSINTSGWGIVALYKNGVEVSRGTQVKGPSTDTMASVVSDFIQLAASDYVEVYYQGVGNAGGTGSALAYFSGFRESLT